MINKKVSCKTIPWCMLMIHRLGIHSYWHQCKVVSVWIPVAENPVCIFMLTTSTTQSWNTSFGWWMFKEMLHNYHCVNWNELFYMFYDSPLFIALLPCCTIPSLHSSPILDHIYWLISQDISKQRSKHEVPLGILFPMLLVIPDRYLSLLGLLDGKWVAFSVHLNMLLFSHVTKNHRIIKVGKCLQDHRVQL